MLILSRKPGEKIVINDGQIVVTIIQGGLHQIKIGIDAPPHINVHRHEVYEQLTAFENAVLEEAVEVQSDE